MSVFPAAMRPSSARISVAWTSSMMPAEYAATPRGPESRKRMPVSFTDTYQVAWLVSNGDVPEVCREPIPDGVVEQDRDDLLAHPVRNHGAIDQAHLVGRHIVGRGDIHPTLFLIGLDDVAGDHVDVVLRRIDADLRRPVGQLVGIREEIGLRHPDLSARSD